MLVLKCILEVNRLFQKKKVYVTPSAGHCLDTHGTLQPEIITKWTPKTLFCVTEMRFSKKIILKHIFHVIPKSQTNTCNVIFRKVIPENSRHVTDPEIHSENKHLCIWMCYSLGLF